MSNQRLAVILSVASVLFFLVAASRAPSTDPQTISVLRGRAMELVSENGEIRARLNVEANGDVVFRIFDQDGTIRLKLAAGKGGSGLVLLDDTTEPGVQILADSSGGVIRLRNKAGQGRLVTP